MNRGFDFALSCRGGKRKISNFPGRFLLKKTADAAVESVGDT